MIKGSKVETLKEILERRSPAAYRYQPEGELARGGMGAVNFVSIRRNCPKTLASPQEEGSLVAEAEFTFEFTPTCSIYLRCDLERSSAST